MSKAYQLAGEALVKAGWADQAVETLEKGFRIAAEKGDVMPRDAIADALRSFKGTAGTESPGGSVLATPARSDREDATSEAGWPLVRVSRPLATALDAVRGDLLHISIKTVEGHRSRIMSKLNIHDLAGLVRYAIRIGLVSPDS